MENYATISLDRLAQIVNELAVQAQAATDRRIESGQRERETRCSYEPDGAGCGPNLFWYKDVFGASESDLRNVEAEHARNFQEEVAAQSNYRRAKACLDRRRLGQPCHPETLETRDPDDVPVPTFQHWASVPCSVFERGYDHCDRYGLVTRLAGISAPPDCVRRTECKRAGWNWIDLGVGAVAVIRRLG